MQSRRDLFTGFGAAALALATPSFAFAAEGSETRRRGNAREDWETTRFSHAVADGVFSAVSAVLSSGASDRARLEVMAHAWRVASRHFDEIGLTSAVDRMAAEASPLDALDAAANSLTEVIESARKHGAQLTVDNLLPRVAIPTARAETALARLREVGAAAIFSEVSTMIADAVAQRGKTRSGHGRSAASLIDNNCQALAVVVDVLWLIAGLWSLGCLATAGVCVPCCYAGVMFGIAAAGVGVIYDYACA